MIAKALAALGLWSVLLSAALAQGTLGAMVQGDGGRGAAGDGGGFAEVSPDTVLRFPDDHAAHPAYRAEWWYLTAILDGEDGRRYGMQWTLFRQALRPPQPDAAGADAGWAEPQFWMAHAAVTTEDDHLAAERFARGGVGQGGVSLDAPHGFEAWLDDWSLAAGPGFDPQRLAPLTVTARDARFSYRLSLTADRPVVLQGEGGYSLKSDLGQASYYYSQPFYAVAGALEIDGARVAVTGRGWLDREWSSQWLAEGQTGWDWMSLHLDAGPSAGAKVMLFQIRHEGPERAYAGNWIAPDGASAPLPTDGVALTPMETTAQAGRDVPTVWRVEIPSKGVDITARALNPLAWMPLSTPYWEGPIAFEGTHQGRGYLEMTGY